MDINWLEAEIERLDALPNDQVGIPVFLIPEDLSAPAATDDAPPEGTELSRAFDAAVAGLEARRGPLSPHDLAAIIKVLAEHYLLGCHFSHCHRETAS